MPVACTVARVVFLEDSIRPTPMESLPPHAMPASAHHGAGQHTPDAYLGSSLRHGSGNIFKVRVGFTVC